jgi:nicotinate-nucleotide adenylyltransferase
VRVGIFGGTFNPIHVGHLALAENVTKAFSLEKMLLIPSKVPPHKSGGIISADQRLEMVGLAAQGMGEKFQVSDYEIKAEGVSYTLKTLKHFRNIYKDDALFFACGTDIFATIEHWYKYEDLFKYANFIVVSRSQVTFDEMLESIPEKLRSMVIAPAQYNDELSGRIILYKMPEVDISSTEIRDIIEDSYRRSNLPDVVYEYISQNKLYEGK